MFAFRRSPNTLCHEKRRGNGGIRANTFFSVHLSDHDFACVTTKVPGHKESTLTGYHSFEDLSGKFFHSKAINFYYYFFLMSKSLSKITLMSFEWETAFKQEITR